MIKAAWPSHRPLSRFELLLYLKDVFPVSTNLKVDTVAFYSYEQMLFLILGNVILTRQK